MGSRFWFGFFFFLNLKLGFNLFCLMGVVKSGQLWKIGTSFHEGAAVLYSCYKLWFSTGSACAPYLQITNESERMTPTFEGFQGLSSLFFSASQPEIQLLLMKLSCCCLTAFMDSFGRSFLDLFTEQNNIVNV